MAAPQTGFAYFHVLPAELQLKILDLALSANTVWAAIPHDYDDANLSHIYYKMVFVGGAPYSAGLISDEARKLLSKTFFRATSFQPRVTADPNATMWINPDTTVISLGTAHAATGVLHDFSRSELSHFKHVAVSWNPRRGRNWPLANTALGQTFMRLANSCPALKTIIVQSMHEPDPEALDQVYPEEPMSLARAKYYISVARNAGPELDDEEVDTDTRTLLLQRFRASPPRIHFLPADSIEQFPQVEKDVS